MNKERKIGYGRPATLLIIAFCLLAPAAEATQTATINSPPSDEPELLSIEWADFDEDRVTTVDRLYLSLQNTSEQRVQAKLFLHTAGFINRDRVIPAAAVSLQANETKLVTIPVERLPLQNIYGASRIMVEAEIKKPDFFEEGSSLVGSKQIFYRFGEDYENLHLFSRKVLREQFGGCTSGKCVGITEDVEMGDLLGRVQGDDGTYSNVYLSIESVEIQANVYEQSPISESINPPAIEGAVWVDGEQE